MGLEPFHFKHFNVAQDHCTHKVGTDGVLLGAWVNIRKCDRLLLDVGTGSGLIALMLAQRTAGEAYIDAIDIETKNVAQARENVAQSVWREKISVHLGPVQQFFPEKRYDLIVSNPPYFVNSLLPQEKERSRARHTQPLSFEDLTQSIKRLLARNGRFSAILPHAEGTNFLSIAAAVGLIPVRKCLFRSRPHKSVERILLELAFDGQAEPEKEIVLYAELETWSPEYQNLIRDFYLKG
ncbi:MAG TPA: methyltransferase [Chryseosolibacter sp.]